MSAELVESRAPREPAAGARVVRAPGKAMVFGEYAVLDGAPAIVAAVDRYATAFVVEKSAAPTDSPFVREALAALDRHLASAGLPARMGGLRIDSSPLYASGQGGRKLGLGSSAAVTVAAFGEPVGAGRAAILLGCLEAHTRAQGGEGSGADVAAAVYGGLIGFQRMPGGAPEVTPLALREDLELTLVDTGVAASTAERLARLSSLRVSDPARAEAVMAPLRALARAVYSSARESGLIPFDAVRAWNAALDALGSAIDLPVVTEAHRAIAACADAVGGAAKPSGAGGGDLAICFTPRGTTADLRARLLERGLSPLAITVGARGLHTAHAPLDAADEPPRTASTNHEAMNTP